MWLPSPLVMGVLGPNAVLNPSFSAADAGSVGAAHWFSNRPFGQFRRVTNVTRSGGASMAHFTNGSRYSTCEQNVEGFVPGMSYRFTLWARAVNVTGAGPGVSAAVTWYDAAGKAAGSATPNGALKGTTDWSPTATAAAACASSCRPRSAASSSSSSRTSCRRASCRRSSAARAGPTPSGRSRCARTA